MPSSHRTSRRPPRRPAAPASRETPPPIAPDQVRAHKLVGHWVCLIVDDQGRPSGEITLRDPVELFAGDDRTVAEHAAGFEANFAPIIAQQVNAQIGVPDETPAASAR